jgi:hypothetical protein
MIRISTNLRLEGKVPRAFPLPGTTANSVFAIKDPFDEYFQDHFRPCHDDFEQFSG